ncbi:MAG: hypothetical protein V4760_10145 [Bdellovibrionota bacterium]
MKYISVVILIALMAWTWSLATAQPAFSLEQSKRVEAGVEKDIRDFIMRRYPDTTDLYCQEMYTEPVVAGTEMLAHFKCRAQGSLGTDETVTQTFQGEIRLRSTDGFETWNEVGGNIRAPEVVYNNGIQVKAHELDVPDAPAPGTPVEPTHK